MPDPGPFGGLPFFGDLMRMIQQQGSIAWDAARQLAVTIASEGEPEANVDPLERMRLEQLARVAELQVTSVTGLTTSVGGRSVEVVPVTRTRWVNATLDAGQPLFSRLADALGPAQPGGQGGQGGPADRGISSSGRAAPDHPAADHPASDFPAVPPTDQPVPGADRDDAGGDWLANMMQALSPMLLGMTAGSMVGHLARRSFGQYDLPIPRKQTHEVMIVPASIDAFGQEWSLEGDDLRLWVCLHELTHHAVLGVPHIRARLERLIAEYAAGFTTDPESLERHLGDIDLGGQAEGMQAFQQLFNDP
jgi:putative hydrolase